VKTISFFMAVSPKRGFENNRGWSSAFRQRTTGAGTSAS
jgi:hypothetical protein